MALERLRETTGLAAKRVAALAHASFPAVPGDEAQWVSDAARNNPNLVALQHAIEAAGKLIESARSEHAPQVALTASLAAANTPSRKNQRKLRRIGRGYSEDQRPPEVNCAAYDLLRAQKKRKPGSIGILELIKAFDCVYVNQGSPNFGFDHDRRPGK